MAYHKGDAECFMRMLRWMDDLHGPSPNPALVVADTGGPEDIHAAVMEMARKVFPCPPGISVSPRRRPDRDGRKPTTIYSTARQGSWASHPDPRPWLWMESDMVPLRPDWIAAIDEAYAKAARPFGGQLGRVLRHNERVRRLPARPAVVDPADRLDPQGMAFDCAPPRRWSGSSTRPTTCSPACS